VLDHRCSDLDAHLLLISFAAFVRRHRRFRRRTRRARAARRDLDLRTVAARRDADGLGLLFAFVTPTTIARRARLTEARAGDGRVRDLAGEQLDGANG